MNSTTCSKQVPMPLSDSPRLLALYADLTKFRLSALTVVTAGAGYICASPFGINWFQLIWTLVGTMACACSAAALNQLAEHRKDAVMHRTQKRPIPAGYLSRTHAFIIGVLLAYLGICLLSFFANIFAAGIALITILIYILVYTPLKTRSSMNTFVGAIVGALPPLIGWVAASGSIGIGGLILAGILFIWQLPHFLALAWMYRDDYERGGFVMLPSLDHSGSLTSVVSLLSSVCLIPLTLLLTITHITGVTCAVIGSLLGLWVVYRSMQFVRERNDERARTLFFSTIMYLPLLLIVILTNRNTIQWTEAALHHG